MARASRAFCRSPWRGCAPPEYRSAQPAQVLLLPQRGQSPQRSRQNSPAAGAGASSRAGPAAWHVGDQGLVPRPGASPQTRTAPRSGLISPGDQLYEGCLAAAARTQKTQNSALLQPQRQPLEGEALRSSCRALHIPVPASSHLRFTLTTSLAKTMSIAKKRGPSPCGGSPAGSREGPCGAMLLLGEKLSRGVLICA